VRLQCEIKYDAYKISHKKTQENQNLDFWGFSGF